MKTRSDELLSAKSLLDEDNKGFVSSTLDIPDSAPLFKLENIILSPHNAALTEEAMIKMATHAAQGILDYLNGKRPKYIVNPEVLER